MRMMFLPLGIALGASATAQAQNVSEPARPLEAERALAITAADNDQRTGIPSAGLTLQASQDASEVSLTLTSKDSGHLVEGGMRTWSIVAKAPLDKSSGSGSFVTEQGLSNKFALEAGYSVVFDPLIGAELTAAGAAASVHFRQKCEQDAPNQADYPKLAPLPEPSPELSLEDRAVLKLRHEKERQETEERQVAFVQSYCIGPGGIYAWGDEKLGKYLTAAEVGAIRAEQRAWRRRDISLLNLTGSVGYGRFKFLDPATFAESKDNKISYSLSVSAGIHPSKTAPFFGAGFEFKREYEGQEKRVICPAATGAGGPTNCRNEIFDAPKADTSRNIFALVRYVPLKEKDSAKFRFPLALELRAAYDIKDKIFGISIPAYFFLDDKKSFRGGAKFQWAERTTESRRDEFTFAVFIVKSLDLFNLK